MIRDAVLAARSSDGALSRWVGFSLAGQHYAVDIRKVQEVVVAPDIEPVPRAPSAVRGVINLRGRIVTVIDLGRCLGFPGAATGASCTVVVADAAGETLGLCVDGVAEICSVAAGAIKPMPPIHGQQPDPLVRGMVRRGEIMLILLDLDQLTPVAAA